MTLGHDVSTTCLGADCSVWWLVWDSGPEGAELNECRCESRGEACEDLLYHSVIP